MAPQSTAPDPCRVGPARRGKETAVNNTWGISGPQFLLIYAGLLVLAGLVVVLGRWVLAKPEVNQPVDPTRLDPYELAVVSGGERLAVTTAIVQLSKAGAVTHAHPVAPAVLDLLAELCTRRPSPGVMLERD